MEKFCPLANIMNILSRKWTLAILHELDSNGKKRFTELITNAEGISARTLSKRLKELEGEKLIERKTFKEVPPRVEYSLTKSGRELTKGFGFLSRWASGRDKNN